MTRTEYHQAKTFYRLGHLNHLLSDEIIVMRTLAAQRPDMLALRAGMLGYWPYTQPRLAALANYIRAYPALPKGPTP